MNRYDIRGSEAVFIDDNESNVEGARNAGLHALHFQGANRLEQDLTNLGVSF